jgi:hypothetical protein
VELALENLITNKQQWCGIELRSLPQGVGTYEVAFDHLNELSGKTADQVVAARKAAIEAARTA